MSDAHDEVATRRTTYERGELDETTVARDPFAQFSAWLTDALAAPAILEPSAMTVATAGTDGKPAARIVLLRQWDARGFVFYTNYESSKGEQLAQRSFAALVFWWSTLERQIRIEGAVERISAAESDAYFATRPRGHRLSAWASRQSTEVPGKAVLEQAMAAAEARFPHDIPRPPYWGGYRVVPERLEFWQGRPNRVHDRIVYERTADAWRIARLSP